MLMTLQQEASCSTSRTGGMVSCRWVPQYGYFPSQEKTWLVVKEEHYEAASATFASSGIQLTRLGRQDLGSAIGLAEFSEAFVKMKVEGWVYEI